MDVNTDTPPISMHKKVARWQPAVAYIQKLSPRKERKDSNEKGGQRRLGGTL